MFDILIKNGQVIDGTGKNPKALLDIGIEKGRIAEIAAGIPEKKAKQVIDARNKLVAPGFIDIQNHSDSYWTLFDQPDQWSLVTQGITSIIIGNCGSSLAPLVSADSIKSIQKWHDLSGVNINWSSFGEFLDVLGKQKLGVNVGSLVGHATLRRGLLSDSVRKVNSDELKIMDRMLAEGMSNGAFGLSMGLIYAHEVNSAKEELLELIKQIHGKGFLSVHLRSESGQILEALDEVIELAVLGQVSLKISHLKIRGKKNWHLEGAVLNKLEAAFHKGLNISFDTYPYHTSWSVLYTYLPKWAYEGGRNEIISMLADSVQRKKILDYVVAQEYDFNAITVAEAEGNPAFAGKTIKQIAANSVVSEAEALLNILAASNSQAVVFDRNLSEDQVDDFLSSPLAMVATDGSGHSAKSFELVHPRCYGTMPRYLKWVREKQKISWEEAICKITGGPAEVLGLTNRGMIFRDAKADVVVFDPQTITDKATYNHPYQFSEGINAVIINGKVTYQDGILGGSHGEVLRRGNA